MLLFSALLILRGGVTCRIEPRYWEALSESAPLTMDGLPVGVGDLHGTTVREALRYRSVATARVSAHVGNVCPATLRPIRVVVALIIDA